jgi:ABC-type Na+ efflux pump permease subunit
VDEDDSLISGFVAGAFKQGELAELVKVEPVSMEEGQERIHDGDGSALLVIPAGFGEAVIRDEPVELTLLTNPSQRILPGIVQGVLEVLVDGAFYAQQVLGEPIRKILDSADNLSGSPSDLLVSDVAVEINGKIQDLEKYLFPPKIVLAIEEEAVKEEPVGLGFGGIMFQSMLFMFLLFASQGVSDELWKERVDGTLRRVVATPGSLTRFLLGKVLAGVVVTGLILAAAMAAGTWLYSLPWVAYLPGLIWMTLVAGMFIALFSVLQLWATSQRGGSILLNLIIFPMMMIGGSFFPPESMPEWLRSLGRFTPNGYSLSVLKTIQAGDVVTAANGAAVAGLLAITLLLLWLGALRLGQVYARAAS